MKNIVVFGICLFLVSCSEDTSEKEETSPKSEEPANVAEQYASLADKGFELLEAYDPHEALKSFEEALEINSDSIRAHYGRAYCYSLFCDMGEVEHEEAIDYWNEVEAMDSCYRNTRFNKAACYASAKKYEEAISYQTLALECNPNDHDIYFNRGVYKIMLGDTSGYCMDMTNGYSLLGHEDTVYVARRKAYEEICGTGLGLDLKDGMSVVLEPVDSSELAE